MTQDSIVPRPATGLASFQTLTSGIRRVIWRHAPTVGFRGTSREDAYTARASRSGRSAAAHLYSPNFEIGVGGKFRTVARPNRGSESKSVRVPEMLVIPNSRRRALWIRSRDPRS